MASSSEPTMSFDEVALGALLGGPMEAVRLALLELDRRVAGVYLKEPRKPRFVFVPFISRYETLDWKTGRYVTQRETLGECHFFENTIVIAVPRPKWRQTVLHELVHLYNPKREHQWIRRAVKDLTVLFKQGALVEDQDPQSPFGGIRPALPPGETP